MPRTTSAPWSVDTFTGQNGSGLSVVHLWKDEDQATHTDEICDMVMDYRGNVPEANATLIAAAPDLLAALKNVVDQATRERKLSVPMRATLEVAQQVIRRAERIASRLRKPPLTSGISRF
jgi:hypothetical protein